MIIFFLSIFPFKGCSGPSMDRPRLFCRSIQISSQNFKKGPPKDLSGLANTPSQIFQRSIPPHFPAHQGLRWPKLILPAARLFVSLPGQSGKMRLQQQKLQLFACLTQRGRSEAKIKKMCAVIHFLALIVFEMTFFTHLRRQRKSLTELAWFERKIQTLACNFTWGSVD